MELKDFIKTTLKELSEAIKESNIELDKKVSLTNVPLRVKTAGDYGLIDFDLAIDVKETNNKGSKAGLKISVAQASIGKNNESALSSSSRIKFTLEANF